MMKNNYLLTESLVSSISVYLILRRLMSEFTDWDAFKLGIIDKDGKKLKHPVTSKEREAWDILTRFCWNLKKTIIKYVGKTKFASYFSAAWLLKDSINLFYIENNLKPLTEDLNNLTFAKQCRIHEILKSLPEINENITIDNLDEKLFKYLQIVENVVNLVELEQFLFEDGEAAAPAPTVAADIAQVSTVIGATKRKLKLKKKRKNYESN